MLNNDDPTVTVCSNRKHSFPVKNYIKMANRMVVDLFKRILLGNCIYFFNIVERISNKFDKIDIIFLNLIQTFSETIYT